MSKSQERIVELITIGILIATFLLLWAQGQRGMLLFFAVLYTLVYIGYSYMPARLRKTSVFIAFGAIELSLAFFIVILEGEFVSQVYLFVLLSHVAITVAFRYGITFTMLCHLCFVLGHWIHYEYPPLEEISYVFPRLFEYLVFFGLSYLAKVAFQQKNQLAQAYERLAEFSTQLEQKTLLEERTRIARDLHDTIGHTIVSALTGVKTSIRFLVDKPDFSLDILKQTEIQLKQGMGNVRKAVHMMQEGPVLSEFIPALLTLVRNTEKQTGIVVEHDIQPDLPRFASQVEDALYRALQEGLTNGIRHGNGNRFHLRIFLKNDELNFELENNGRVWNDEVFGFGLSAMQARVNDVGGRMVVTAAEKRLGTRIYITIPLKFANMKEEVS